jgi:cytochrome c oxidase subunit I+III
MESQTKGGRRMSGGHNNHVDNSVWSRAILMAGAILTIGIVAFAALGLGVGSVKHDTYDDAKAAYYEAMDDPTVSESELEHLHHEEIDAHLSYLTYWVAGITILIISAIYAIFLGIGGFINLIQPQDDYHDDHHDDDHHDEHHGSASPIIFCFGVLLFLMGFPDFVEALRALMSQGGTFAAGDLVLSTLGLTVIMIGVANWWREDLPFIGHGEQIATSAPFEGEHIRKAGLWVFIMSEVMVFATFFSSYLRVRTEWCTKWAFDDGKCSVGATEGDIVLTASDYLRPGGAAGTGDFWTMLPGAVNTFALIISSYTIVLALKTAKSKDWEAPKGVMRFLLPDKKTAVRNYLIATLLLGSMFIVLKLVEWSHLVAEGFTVGTVQGSIFYVATGAHGLHVFVGLLIMLYLVFKADTIGYDEDNGQGIEYFGLYWHFVDLAWVVIFPAFYLY